MLRTALTMGLGALLWTGCQEPPPNNPGTTATTEPTTGPTTTGTTSSTTFPTDTTFGGNNNQEPDHWLIVTEIGQLNFTPAGGPYTGLSGMMELTEIVDELDIDLGPDCLASWTLSGSEPALSPATCPGCSEAVMVSFTLAIGDAGPCQSPDLPPNSDQVLWRMAWNPADQTVYREINGTGVWVAWWPGVKVGDTVDFTFADSWAIFVEEEM